MVTIKIAWSDTADQTLGLPEYQTAGAAGADVRANIPDRTERILAPGARCAMPTGLRMQIPDGFEVQMRPRSGLALRQGLTMANAPGTIDSDFRGEVHVLLINLGDQPVRIAHGDRIAQMVVAPVSRAVFSVVDDLDGSERGAGGFGSTGVSK